MLDILGMIASLKRPGLLVRTARFGVDDYRRDIHLPRILRNVALPRHGEALIRLLEIEDTLNALRLGGHAEYAVARHVEVMIAIMGEARLMRATLRPVAVADPT
ncbi:MAG: hypothetical protein GC146_12985 [Limimaricola sp.]|uniref:DUF6477 family protein n=1 Tax=Limimaricola sp. TaxID=2211665 RepID=UPI001D3AB941|nr:DUF6477 family protein [Limimaricola sp.]MBI1418130.1 hypothetical protein [Limimaricola sp.]